MKTIRLHLLAFITLLVLSGLTAFPLRTELQFLMQHLHWFPSFMQLWLIQVGEALEQTPDLVLYGTDWLAFAHLVIALFFVPVYRQPLRYQANLLVAMAACLGVFALAFICGPIRGIPFFHRLIDCAFGFIGFWQLLFVYKKINRIKTVNTYENTSVH